jgi:multiple sugar transport system ATP-binding protein
MSSIRIANLRKTFGRSVVAVDDVTIEIEDGEFFVLVGPSGSGKTTVLRMVAGLEEPDRGTIQLGDVDVTRMRPKDRDIAMVFQDYALYPQLTVRENLVFGLRRRRAPKADIEKKVRELAAVLELEELLDRRPAQLSGGQRQRVALGRAIARTPRAFLMDEPLSNLDANLRTTMRTVLAQLRERLQTTTLYVTHDQVEAMTLGDRVAVMRSGSVDQLAAPRELYERPANLFVAAFIGSPHINLVETTVDDGAVAVGDVSIPIVQQAARALEPGRPVVAGIRPVDLEDEAFALDPRLPKLTAHIAVRNDLGAGIEILFPVEGRAVERADLASAMEGGELAERDLVAGRHHRPMFTAQINAGSRVREGGRVRLVVDPRRLYLFDAETGALLAAPSEPGAGPPTGRPQAELAQADS